MNRRNFIISLIFLILLRIPFLRIKRIPEFLLKMNEKILG